MGASLGPITQVVQNPHVEAVLLALTYSSDDPEDGPL